MERMVTPHRTRRKISVQIRIIMILPKIPTPQYNSSLVILERYDNLLIEASLQGSNPTRESKLIDSPIILK